MTNTSPWRGAVAALLCTTLAGGCATAGVPRIATAPGADPAVLAAYVQTLPPGTPVRVDRRSGTEVRGTLLSATAARVLVQPRTRVPVPPVEVPLDDVASLTPDQGGNTIGKAIAAGAAAGAGAALAVIFVLAAIFGD
ncbi:MAG TPA: hypothetical protein VM364_12890 [Vicinamibacterales bacterium]|nr:hypothetical protein [Vicinamibacterales bacterium]